MDVLTAFTEAFKKSGTSDLEMSWNFEMSVDAFKTMMNGENKLTDKQEHIMLKYLFKDCLKFNKPAIKPPIHGSQPN